MSESSVSRDIDGRHFVVNDMVTELFTTITDNSRWPFRRAVYKRFNMPSKYVGTIGNSNSLRRVIEDNPGLGEPSLFFEQDKEKIERVALEVGKLSLCLQSPVYDLFMDRRSLLIDGTRTPINTFTEEIWAPDYAERFTEAMIMGIRKENVEEMEPWA